MNLRQRLRAVVVTNWLHNADGWLQLTEPTLSVLGRPHHTRTSGNESDRKNVRYVV